jgi:hypothetical protein
MMVPVAGCDLIENVGMQPAPIARQPDTVFATLSWTIHVNQFTV